MGCYVEEVLQSELKAGQMVILDHLSCDQVSTIEEGVEKAGGVKMLTS